MFDFFLKLFGKNKVVESTESVISKPLVSDKKKTSGRRFIPTEINWSQTEYIPLPPSPPTWEVDGRDEFNREYNDPILSPIFNAWFKNQYTKIVKLASDLSPEQRQGQIGDIIAKAYGKLVLQRIKSEQFAAAAKQSIEMFEMIPDYVKDTDRRRFNQILANMDKAGKKHSYTPIDISKPSSLPLFTLSENATWGLKDERKLNTEERPDPSFDIVSIDVTGTWLLDRSGTSKNSSDVKSVLRRIDRNGLLVCEKALSHDVYHIGTNVVGSSIAIMNSDGILYVYDATLNLIVENDLSKDERVVDHFRTIETNYWGELRSQIRAVDISPEGDRYLFTLADEVWCCTTSGDVVWGVVMPLKEGWKRVVGRSERFGVSHDVNEALQLFGLSLPINPADIKRKYRELAHANHPDRNPNNPNSTEKMKTINHAFEILTGVDPNTLGFEESDITYFARTAPDHVIMTNGFRFEITITGGVPQDWVYAASFASTNGETYLATYSGKVILVSRDGRPNIVYDIGVCPNEIIDTGRYTYFLTSTRLYVIEDRNKLASFIDVFQKGKLIVTQAGFGLLTSKQLQWFTETGVKVCELASRDPIRAIHAIDGSVIIKTRQHQVRVDGFKI